MADWKQWIIGPAMFFISFFLILLVLVQRGRGGGLAGALGGAGGQSAFGTKAGDVFTKITVGFAAIWILLCVLALTVLQDTSSGQDKVKTPDGFNATAGDDTDTTPAATDGLNTDPSEETEAPMTETKTTTTDTEAEATTVPSDLNTEPAETPPATE
ncbi:MAG: preprotein translocase subunit SecG [Blastopirellula sp.]|nr:MAG: preprotein translocase subunit SecG [Blastopirellula sp.]